MKKFLALFLCATLVFAMSTLLLTSCGKADDAKDTTIAEDTTPVDTDESANLSGGWTASTVFEGANVPDEALDALNSALEGLVGASYSIAGYLGSQVVAGTNYAYLCEITPVVPDAVATLNVVTVYKDLDGKCEITSTEEINISDYAKDEELSFTELSGGWNVEDASEEILDDATQAAFDKALEEYTGVGMVPSALLGTQVVAGTNYALLCKAMTMTSEPVTQLAVVIIYADLNGGAQINSICPFEIAK